MAVASTAAPSRGLLDALNGRFHRASLNIFLAIVVAHWAEHLVQAYQIWVLNRPRPKSRGVLGQYFPWLVSSEWLHYGYAIVMLVGLWMLRRGFHGRAKAWWTIALVIQFWHHVEHFLLMLQAQTHTTYFGKAVPTSILQLVIQRVEPHLFYNSIVFIPMIIGMYLHLRPNSKELAQSSCSCVGHTSTARPVAHAHA